MIYRWNDNVPLHHAGKIFKKGDTISQKITSDICIKLVTASGKIIIFNETEIKPFKPIKLSISVMAHPSRQEYFQELQDKLNIPMSQFAVDKKNNLIENCKAAWRLYDKTADFHVVIQDDAIVCNYFRERAEQFLNERESERIAKGEPVYGYNFFIKREYDTVKMESFVRQGYLIEPRNRGGVAICLPVNQIESMLRHFNTTNSRHDDERINNWIVANGFKMIFPLPSLVDHNDHNSSLAGNPINQGRQAYKYIDNMKVTIPKIIHQLWIGDKPRPLKWMQTWKEKNPAWEYKLWTDEDILMIRWINQKHIDYYYKNKVWHGVKDVCQYEILHKYGGCFFDADAECLMPIDELFCANCDAYSYYESEEARSGLIQPLIASVKNSYFAAELIEGLKNINIGGVPWQTTGNKYVGDMYKKTKEKVRIFPSHYFNPEHFSGIKYEGYGKIFGRHYYGSTIDNTYDKGI